MERYETGRQLLSAGVISGYDITPESAITKLMFLLGQDLPVDEIRKRMGTVLAGEVSR
jgi:L-asparaginase